MVLIFTVLGAGMWSLLSATSGYLVEPSGGARVLADVHVTLCDGVEGSLLDATGLASPGGRAGRTPLDLRVSYSQSLPIRPFIAFL